MLTLTFFYYNMLVQVWFFLFLLSMWLVTFVYLTKIIFDWRFEIILWFSLWQEALESLHNCLKEMPTEKDEEQDPRGLKSGINLFPHQRQGLAW